MGMDIFTRIMDVRGFPTCEKVVLHSDSNQILHTVSGFRAGAPYDSCCRCCLGCSSHCFTRGVVQVSRV